MTTAETDHHRRSPSGASRSGGPDRRPVILDVRVVTGSGGGPDKTILNSPRYLAPAGYRNLCAYMHPPDDEGFDSLRVRAQQLEAPLISVPDRGPLDLRVASRLLGICRREGVAAWHGHDYKSNLLGLLLRPVWPMALVTTVHGWGVQATRRTPIYNRIDRLCLPFYDRVIAVSEDLRSECAAAGVPESRCLLVENGIDLGRYRRDRGIEQAKAALGLPAGRLLVGAVGRLSGEKGFDLLIEAVDHLASSGLDVGLAIVGEGTQRAMLEARIARSSQPERFLLAGYRSNVIPFYEAMDVFALSSLSEGLPNVLLEAMALGVPVVASRIAGIPRLIRDGDDGLLVTPGSAGDLAYALNRLLVDPSLRDEVGRRGQLTVRARYCFEARMRRIIAIYDELLRRVASSRRGSAPDADSGVA